MLGRKLYVFRLIAHRTVLGKSRPSCIPSEGLKMTHYPNN